MTKIIDLLVQLKPPPGHSNARRLIAQGAVCLDGQRMTNPEYVVAPGEHTLHIVSEVRKVTVPSDAPEDSLDNAINRLAKHIENGELLSCTNPVAFLDTVTEKLEHTEAQLQVFVEWTCEVSAHGMVPGKWILDKLRELGLVKR